MILHGADEPAYGQDYVLDIFLTKQAYFLF